VCFALVMRGFGITSVIFGGIKVKMKNIQNQIAQLDFSNAYETLKSLDYDYGFRNVSRDFKKIDSIKMYAFMMFAVAKDEDIVKHLTICNYLFFINPYINGADEIIRWHILRSLEISPESVDVIRNWVMSVYSGNPDCPFTENELQKLGIKDNYSFHS